MSEKISRSAVAFSDKAGLVLIAVAIALVAYEYLFSENRTTYILKSPLVTSLDGFAKHYPEWKITSIVPLPGHSGCYNRDTDELVVCVWVAQTKLRHTRFSQWLLTIGE